MSCQLASHPPGQLPGSGLLHRRPTCRMDFASSVGSSFDFTAHIKRPYTPPSDCRQLPIDIHTRLKQPQRHDQRPTTMDDAGVKSTVNQPVSDTSAAKGGLQFDQTTVQQSQQANEQQAGLQAIAPFKVGTTHNSANLPSFAPSVSAVQRKPSAVHAIAPALQIPTAVNNSHGSLAELAAQITSLFWFEKSEVLNAAERGVPLAYQNGRLVLSPEALPSTGFRKWVTTILSTTQVAQNVVILALLFIYRLKKQNPGVQSRPGSEFRLLTVALMLGNKFLDDNTYTNKTWSEVSGISVSEVYVMELEFLGNMKYNLFTSSAQWSVWQALLGRFAKFIDLATQPAPVLPSPMFSSKWNSLSPTPPGSFQQSPLQPSAQPLSAATYPMYKSHAYPAMATQYSMPRTLAVEPSVGSLNARKRSLDDAQIDVAAKRQARYTDTTQDYSQRTDLAASTNPNWPPYNIQTSMSAIPRQQVLPSQPYQPGKQQGISRPMTNRAQMGQLPPIVTSSVDNIFSAVPWSQTAYGNARQVGQWSHQNSPHSASTVPSPSPYHNSAYPPNDVGTVHQHASISRHTSPYRAMREVSTLLVPPPSRALHQPEHVNYTQMHYQPLGRPLEERQQGRLPYVAQNQWVDESNGIKTATPVEQWSCFENGHVGFTRTSDVQGFKNG